MSLFASDLPDDRVGGPEVPGPGRTPPPVRAPRTARVDLDDWGEAARGGGPRRWLLLAAVVPWLVVGAIIMTGERGDPSGGAAADAPPAVAPTGTTGTTAPDPIATPTTDPTVPVEATGAPTTGDPGGSLRVLASPTGPGMRGQAEGLALVVARSWLSTRPAGVPVEGLTPAPGADQRYVEHLAVEAVDHPARGALVVTVRAIVLPVEGDVYGAARHLRLAVPVVLDIDHPRLGGAPWLLPSSPVALDPPERAPVDDPDLMLAAVEAVGAVGYRDVELLELSRTDGWAWVAELQARAPEEDAVRRHEVWLRSDVGRLVVAGAAAPIAAPPPTAGSPDDDPTASDSPTEVPS